MSAAAFVLGLGFGGAAAALYMAQQATKPSAAVAPSRPVEPLAPAGPRIPITAGVWIPQTPADVEALLRTACGCVDAAGHRLEDDDLAVRVWKAHWPAYEHPGQPVAGDHPTVREAMDAVRAAIKAARDGECQKLPSDLPDVEPDVEPNQPPSLPPPPLLGATPVLPKAKLLTATPVLPATPKVAVFHHAGPIDVQALTREEPTPGYFYQVRPGERFLGDDGIIARALEQVARATAVAKGWSTSKAQAHATVLAADVKARISYLSIIQCGPWNDAMYGTWGYAAADFPAAHGRAIRLIARHDRVADRLGEGHAPIRTLDRGTPSDKATGVATGAGDALEFLWLPPLRSDALLDATRAQQVVAEGLVWPDGSSKFDPPPAVLAHGITNAPAAPWGCLENAA